MKTREEEVGDLFITEKHLMLKLLPSNKSGSKPIEWFANGIVRDHEAAAEDIALLVSKLKGKSRVVKGLTLMTDKGLRFDVVKSGLAKAVQKAGFEVIN